MRVAIYIPGSGLLRELDAHLARTPEERAAGFSWRATIAPNEAIFFAFPSDTNTSFTMSKTFVSLDMLFLDETGHTVGIVENARPMTVFPYTSPRPYRYVLEVPGGWLKANGVGYDATVAWQSFQPPT